MGAPILTVCIKLLVCVSICSLILIATVWQSIVLTSVADPEGVPWVLWNPSFQGLSSKIPVLCANVLRTVHDYAHTGATHIEQ